MKFREASLASAVALIFLVAGCGGSGQGAGLPAPEKANIVVDAFPAIDSAGLYIAQMDHLFAAQGLNVTIETAQTTQAEVNGQVQGRYDITTGDYVTYINNELTGPAKLRIVAEASFLQPNVLTLLVRGGSSITSIGELRDKSISINAPDDIGTLLVDSLLVEHGIPPRDVKFDSNVAFPAVAASLEGGQISAAFAPEPFVSLDEQKFGIQELADLDQGSTVDFPIQGYAVTRSLGGQVPAHAGGVPPGAVPGPGDRRHGPDRRGTRAGQVPADPAADRGVPLAAELPDRGRSRAASARGERHAAVRPAPAVG